MSLQGSTMCPLLAAPFLLTFYLGQLVRIGLQHLALGWNEGGLASARHSSCTHVTLLEVQSMHS
jgi:hypothetical protein